MTNGSAVSSRLRFESFSRSRGCRKPKNPSSSKLTGVVCFFVTNCLRLSYYYHFKVIRPLKKANFRFSALGLSQSTDFWSESGIEKIYNRKPLKSYTNRPKFMRLLPILHEQFNFYIPQHGRALIPCRLPWSQI